MIHLLLWRSGQKDLQLFLYNQEAYLAMNLSHKVQMTLLIK